MYDVPFMPSAHLRAAWLFRHRGARRSDPAL